jgi:uncharacterized protein
MQFGIFVKGIDLMSSLEPSPVPHSGPVVGPAPVSLADVFIEDRFWAPRLEVNRRRGLAYQYAQLRAVGVLDAFDLSRPAGPLPIPFSGDSRVTPVMWWDSDVAKWLEAASYSLATHPDPQLEALVDQVIAKIAGAQQPDGYLNSYFTGREPGKRWTNERDWHELYCAGHLIEAAVAHFEATGKRTLLSVLERYVDLIASVYGPNPGQKHGYPGHEEIELALVKLHRVTNNPRHLELARYFVDARGRQPFYFDLEAQARGDDPAAFHFGNHEYSQAHKPVREQTQVVGHAVRAMYLYAAMADLAGELNDLELRNACERLWDDLTGKRLYITGGLGPSKDNEGFTVDYDLPNETAYAETCAAVALVFWARRMVALTGEARYADVMERALYNNVLAGVSLNGERFFYDNVLESQGDKHRWAWHSCPCCPPNLLRLLASFGGYIYSQRENISINLYVQGSAVFQVAGQTLKLQQRTDYPWDGAISIRLELETPAQFALRLRIPGWCRGASLTVNGQPVQLEGILEHGFATLERTWQANDEIRLELPMPVERIRAHPNVRADAGCVALQRGPILYCLEGIDHDRPLRQIVLPADAKLEAHFEPELLEGVTVLTGLALAEDLSEWEGSLYRMDHPTLKPVPIKAVPYCTWDGREPGEMRVWIRSQ